MAFPVRVGEAIIVLRLTVMGRKKRVKFYWVFGIFLTLGFGLLFWSLPRPAEGGATALQLTPTRTPAYNPTPTPPTQGGHGHDVFQLNCMPCHGDVGQGLTDEFRLRVYPPEDTNCWKSGCHGPRPYDNGFILPKTVPALIGADALKRFTDAQMLYDFIHKAMPFNAPGSLTSEQYLQLTAFLLEQNHLLAQGSQLNVAMLRQIPIRPAATPMPPSQTPTADSPWLLIGVMIGGVLILVIYVIQRVRSSSASH